MKTKIDVNSVSNQEIKRQFIDREVIYCQSMLVDKLLQTDFYNYGDIDNAYTLFGEHGTGINECQDCGKHTEIDVDANTCEDCFAGESVEIFEWWIVSDYLLNKLAEKNQPILRTDYENYWGRTCSGQAILLDFVISEICSDMEILEGQKYSWSK